MNKSNTKIVFMGTPDFSAKILEGILNDGYDVIGVITEPDKPTGRKMEIIPTPVKKFALERGLKVFQPEKKAGVAEAVRKLSPDLCVVAAYGKIITKEALEAPKHGCINFHASLLPDLRGASPVQSAILQGLDKTGVTIMMMDEGMDTGPILSQMEIPLDEKETATTLRTKMLKCGLPLLLNTIPGYVAGEITSSIQDDKATYCKMIEKEDGKIDFGNKAMDEERKTRAFNEWPGAYAFWNGKRIKFVDVNFNNKVSNYKNGEVFADESKNFCIKFGDGIWIVAKLQLEGKNVVNAKDFLNGNRAIIGAVLK